MTLKVKPLERYVDYIQEREAIRIKKEAGEPWPWTKNKILQTYKFTNVQRKHDRTTKFLKDIYTDHWNAPPEEALYNCGLYRYFGTVGFASAIGWMDKHDRKHILNTVKLMNKCEVQVFTGAYIVTNAGRHGPKEEAVANFLADLWMLRRTIVEDMIAEKSWRVGYEQLKCVDGFGGSGFMAKEVLQDWLLWNTRFAIGDIATWTPVGPGGRRGLNRLHGRDLLYRQPEQKFIDECVDLWRQLALPNLTAHDIQFCLCEFDKMERVRLKQGRPRSKYVPPVDDARNS